MVSQLVVAKTIKCATKWESIKQWHSNKKEISITYSKAIVTYCLKQNICGLLNLSDSVSAAAES